MRRSRWHARAFVRWSEARGRSSVALWRADPTLLTELQLGAFHRATTFGRGARRVLMVAGRDAGGPRAAAGR